MGEIFVFKLLLLTNNTVNLASCRQKKWVGWHGRRGIKLYDTYLLVSCSHGTHLEPAVGERKESAAAGRASGSSFKKYTSQEEEGKEIKHYKTSHGILKEAILLHTTVA